MATIEKVTPAKGKVGNVAVLHGSGLTGTAFVVKFGRATAPDASNPGNSPDNIKCTVPAKDALDPASVAITVTIDGVPATVAPGVSFEYNVPQPEPRITGVDNVAYDPSTFGLTFSVTGTDFVKAGREPDPVNAYIVDADPTANLRTVRGSVLPGFTATRMDLSFSNVRLAGLYAAVVGFTDGAGATSPAFQVG